MTETVWLSMGFLLGKTPAEALAETGVDTKGISFSKKDDDYYAQHLGRYYKAIDIGSGNGGTKRRYLFFQRKDESYAVALPATEPVKAKRKRRTKAEMAEARKAEQSVDAD